MSVKYTICTKIQLNSNGNVLLLKYIVNYKFWNCRNYKRHRRLSEILLLALIEYTKTGC